MPQATEHVMSLAAALRNFFSATRAEKLAAAVPALCAKGNLGEDDVRELEFEFNRLFVGPDSVPAPPFASVYLEREPQLMGQSTLEMRELYLGLGLAVPTGGGPDDFLPYELDAWLRLCALATGITDADGSRAILEARRWLVLEHMDRWIPVFIQRALAASPSPIMTDILKTLENWLQAAKENP